ncbi:MAG: hypothetical protein JO247_02190, partial [Chloroflexi bacterium]|nr:hypothetical protein [Chloroflexota bacterium]
VSQLGYMFAGIGFGVPFAAIFHLGSQAFYKALLFLAAGVVIHALGGQEELAAMGGLARRLPLAMVAFLIGSLSLFGLPLTAGGFSKDAIIDGALASPSGFIQVLGWLLVLGALLSGLYMGRLFFATFFGRPSADHHVHSVSRLLTWPLVPLALGALLFGFAEFPLGGLGSVLGGVLEMPESVGAFTPAGLLAAVLGLGGFLFAGWWQSRRGLTVAYDGPGWVDRTAHVGANFAAACAAVQNGRAGRYVLATVLGFAAILVAGLKG